MPGPGFVTNPFVPGTWQHASLVVAALSAIHAFSQDQEAFLATRLHELVDMAAKKNVVPEPGELVAPPPARAIDAFLDVFPLSPL